MDQKKIQFLKNLSTGLVIAAIILAFMITGIRIFGIQVYGVLTGSMEPTYPTGSLIYVKPVDTSTLRVNDVITFSLSPGTIATHRIVEIVPDENYPSIIRYRTKGDANNDVDPSLVSASNIIGKALFAIPYLGSLANYIQSSPGIYVAIIFCGLLIAFVFYTDSLETKMKEQAKAAEAGAGTGADDPVPDKQPFNLVASINKISQKLIKKDLIKVKEADEPAFQRGYTPPQPTAQPMQYAQQQTYPGMQQPYQQSAYPQQTYPQQGSYPQQAYPQQAYPQQMYQQPYPGMQQAYPQQGAYPQQAGYPQQSAYPQYPQQSYPQQAYQQPYPGVQQAYPQQGGQQRYPVQGQQLPQQQAQMPVPQRPVAAGGAQQNNPAAQHTPKH